MDFVFWIILIVLIVGVVWWLFNRNSSSAADRSERVRTDGGLAAGSAAAAEEEPHPSTGPATAVHPGSPVETEAALAPRSQAGEPEWETQWSEAAPPDRTAGHGQTADESHGAAASATPAAASSQEAGYVHHPEYTEPHAPTLPGAETAAAEAAEAEEPADDDLREAAAAGPAPATGVDATPDLEAISEPSGHLALEHPYGAGSASPAADGSRPAGFEVKGDAGTMVYYEEGHADYEQASADVWFESTAHAEAAGFRAPRRGRA